MTQTGTTEHDQSAVTVIRKALEGVLSPSATSSVLFEALGNHGQSIPRSTIELTELVRGSLSIALSRRLGPTRAAQVVSSIERAIETAPFGEPEPLRRPADPDATAPLAAVMHGRDADATATVPTATAAVDVEVFAAGRGFVDRLVTVLGPRRVAPSVTSDIDRVGRSTPPPAILVVDATDFTPTSPGVVSIGLARFPTTTAIVVWGAELPYGRSIVKVAAERSLHVVPLPRAHGIDPLLDLIRSRRRPT
jgi:hypothetical protein